MSRFFETLKEVSRSQQKTNGTPPNGKPEESRSNGLESFPLMTLPEVTATVAPEEEPPLEVPHIEIPHGDLLDSIAPQQRNGLFAKAAEVALDRKAPLLPHSPDTVVVEQYRRLRTKIMQQHETKPIKSLLVASPGPGEGKTVTVMNLGLSFAMLPSFKVVVIDGDLRKGTLGKWLGVGELPGLTNLIDGSARLEDVVFKADNFPVHFMVRGNSPKPPGELLNSQVLPNTIRRMTEHFDLVLVDSPPVNLIADTQMLASSCDGVLLVARAFSTTCKAFQKMMSDLLPFRIIGTVLNGGKRSQLYSRHYYKY